MNLYDKVKHPKYGDGIIIKLCEKNRYSDVLVEFEKENYNLDNGNCIDTGFLPIGKEYKCKYCRYEELETKEVEE